MLPPVSLGQGAPASAPTATSTTSKPAAGSASFGDIMDGLTAPCADHSGRPSEESEARVENPTRSRRGEEEDDNAEDSASTRRVRRSTSGGSLDQTQIVSTVIVGVPMPPPAPAPVRATPTHASTGTDTTDTAGSAQRLQLSHAANDGTKPQDPAAREPRAASGTSSAQEPAAKSASTESLAELLSPARPPAKGSEPSHVTGPSTAPASKQETGAETTRTGSMANGPPDATGKHSLTANGAEAATFSHLTTREMPGGKACSLSEAHLGTPGAQELVQMKKAEKMSKVAGSAQQILPEQGDRTTSTAGISADREGPSAPMVGNDQISAASALNIEPGSLRVEHNQAISASVDSTRLASLERTHDLVAAHALRLRESGAEHLRVVIQPGDGTHLAIELKHANGRIEAQATLQQGDFEHLNRHWAELQQRLESRKVQLSPLQQTGQTSAENHPSSQQHKRPSKEEQTGSYTTDFVFGGSMTESPVSRTARKKLNHGWETWA